MAAIFYVLFIALVHPVSPHSFEKYHKFLMGCPPSFNCGKLGQIRFPFTTLASPDYCGAFVIDGCEKEHQKIELEKGSGKWFEVESISQANTISIIDEEFRKHLISKSCESLLNNLSLPSLPYASFQIKSNLTFYRCNSKPNIGISANVGTRNFSCNEFVTFYSYKNTSLPSLPPSCSIVQLPVHTSNFHDDIFDLLSDKFSLEITFDKCSWCKSTGYNCCPWNEEQQRGFNFTRKIQLALCTGFPTIITVLLFIILHCRQKIRNNRNYASSPSSAKAPELTTRLEREGNVCLEVPIFSDAELQEATNNFSARMELGNGGFGTVYYGKLRDGREVAVKRLYDHSYKRVKQFLNEIEILTRVRHKNLVTLYGCSARQSHGLLLVYEYVPNGTVADHLHGGRTMYRALTWPIRMRIAIETATALSHLHASDIIHRDVKTRNILLDENFSVKVADFGLSRLFPDELSHISTAPQGSPGYVDPGYYHCYQLTDKSDVYSFGVVLIELISSLPAIDITRNQHEINLATFALNRIQKCAFDELIDPHLGHKMDEHIRTMTTSVAELAFLCLQPDREMRPSMDEVLEQLKRIESWGMHCDLDASQKVEPPSSQQDCDVNALLKNTQPPSSSNFDIERCGN